MNINILFQQENCYGTKDKKAIVFSNSREETEYICATLREIAEYKMPDLNANDVEGAMRIIAGTARNMGIEVESEAN